MTTTTLWDDPDINKTITLMDPKTRYEYSKIGENLFQIPGDAQSADKRDPDSCLFEIAAQLKLMLRDGLDSNKLTDDECRILVSVYGPDAMEQEYGIKCSNPIDSDGGNMYDISFSYPYENEQQQTISNGISENKGKD